jgi:hypothetical protein
VPLARLLRFADPARGAARQAGPLTDRPEPARAAGRETTNGDGFGVGWYGDGETPWLYRSTHPAWNDRNLRELAAGISSRLFFAHIRASTGTAIQETNTHPFRHGRWLWMHNGLIRGFHRLRAPARGRRLAVQVDRGDDGLGGDVPPRAHVRPRGRPRGRRRAHGGISSRRPDATMASSILSR